MNSLRRRSTITGILFLTAMAASLAGGGLVESAIQSGAVSESRMILIIGVSLELLNGIAVIGIAASLFPLLKHISESLALGYFGLRIIEAFLCIISAFVPILIFWLETQSAAVNPDTSTIQVFISAVRAHLTGIMIPLFFSFGAIILYYLLWQSELVPRFVSAWGFIASLLVTVPVWLKNDEMMNMLFVLPIILNEIFLGILLIIKGFNNESSYLRELRTPGST
jgi:hypothetical protein